MIQAALFDLDGTLADTAPDLGNALNRLRQAHGLLPLPLQTIRPFASHGARGLLEVGFGLRPENESFIVMRDELLNYYEERLCEDTVLFPGTDQLLDELDQRKLAWGIVTNKATRFTKPLVAQLGLCERAGCVVSGDTCARSKPYPDPLLHASDVIKIPPEYCVYVGDAERDIQAGIAAGMQTVIARYGYIKPDETPLLWKADSIIDSPQELLHRL